MENTMREMLQSDFGDIKLDKSIELNPEMTLENQQSDELANAIRNLINAKGV